ncbi:hypothetical protein PV08_03134 [Exophiala spinifera]|uniref:TEA domain-containing protein n=1 Tax=Exophiala spinifera TaxID=91928 RepID=A0A0D2BJS6_9EURO|nr:uncharacterized protein PV08_03134 [Exophiala spinifera]KIW18845.1 hypothetical protein PV08_03134 [Exophiala spinifera]
MNMLHSVSFQSHQKPELGVNPLSITSGNIQSTVRTSQDGLENEQPLTPPRTKADVALKSSLHQLPLPTAPLCGNDALDFAFDRAPGSNSQPQLLSRRHAPRPARSFKYTKNHKYQIYRRRPRQDIGGDGKPVWPLFIEDAFQEALQCIQPMGRKKWARGGKLNGRNMLISEFIYHRTGQRRTRKQVSSHIQVLDKFLRNEPEWVRLTKVPDEAKRGTQTQCKGTDFQRKPFDDNANIQHRTLGGLEQPYYHQTVFKDEEPWDDGDDTLFDSSMPTFFLASYIVQHMQFEVRVIPPPSSSDPELDSTRVLHHYTQLSSRKGRPRDVSLNSLSNWSNSFPRLHTILDELCTSNPCEVILLNSSFQLMDGFPPEHSKLGISLEVDFLCQDWPEMDHNSEAKRWSVATHIYQDGQLVAAPTHEECRATIDGLVEPSFHSTWWASALTNLTAERLMAKDSSESGALQAADEYSRGFFAGLTIMQEIFALRYTIGENLHTKREQPRRAAILLWKFAQAESSSERTTTWQPLTLPEPIDRGFKNSPLVPSPSTELPPLPISAMDYDIGSIAHDPSRAFDGFGSFPTAVHDDMCQGSSFTTFNQELLNGDPLQSTLDVSTTQRLDPESNYPNNLEYSGFSPSPFPPAAEGPVPQAGNIFYLPNLAEQDEAMHTLTGAHEEVLESTRGSHPGLILQTHQALQEHISMTEGLKIVIPSSKTLTESEHQSQTPDIQPWDKLPEEEIRVLRFLTEKQQTRKRQSSDGDKEWSSSQDEQATHRRDRHAHQPLSAKIPEFQSHWGHHVARPAMQTHHSFDTLPRHGSSFADSTIGLFDHTFHDIYGFTSSADPFGGGGGSDGGGQIIQQQDHPFSTSFLPSQDGDDVGSRGLPRAHSESDICILVGGSENDKIPPLPPLPSDINEPLPVLNVVDVEAVEAVDAVDAADDSGNREDAVRSISPRSQETREPLHSHVDRDDASSDVGDGGGSGSVEQSQER